MATGLTGITNAFTLIQTDLSYLVIPSATVAGVFAGLSYAHVFHSPQMQQFSKDVLKYSVISLVVAGGGPLLIKALGSAVGLP